MMKKQLQIIALSLGLCAMSFTSLGQTVRRVNGDPNITGVNVYNTIQAAVDAANTDDVILIEPWGEFLESNTNSVYDENLTISKKLHFRGNGYELGNQTNLLVKKRVYVSSLTFNSGSAGSSVKFLESNRINIAAENVTIESCKLLSFGGAVNIYNDPSTGPQAVSKGTGATISKCQVLGSVTVNLQDPYNSQIVYDSGLTISNSYVAQTVGSSTGTYLLKGASIINCGLASVWYAESTTVVNCIFTGNFDQNVNVSTSISHCISTGTGLPTLSNNTNNVLASDIWVDSAASTEEGRKLSVTSIAKGYGINGEDIGEYGGSDPYRLSGLPHSPIATDFQNTQVGNNSINIQAQVSFQAN